MSKKVLIDKNLQQKNEEHIVALAGNPNVGKSTVFNYITGLKQHTGNWTGKTVSNAYGRYEHNGKKFVLVDLPGTYSLIAQSKDEEAARDFICFGEPEAVIVVTDATALERNMNLVLQILEVTNRVVICVNLIDEAARKGIFIDVEKMHERLCVPVVATNAKTGDGIEKLLTEAENAVCSECTNLHIPQCSEIENAVAILLPHTHSRWVSLKLLENDASALEQIFSAEPILTDHSETELALEKAREYLVQNGIDESRFREMELEAYYRFSEELMAEVVRIEHSNANERDRKIDKILTSKKTGIPIMLGFLCLILWITIVGANYPSDLLSTLLFGLEEPLLQGLAQLHAPQWLSEVLVSGMYRTLSWVVSVMLPPMAIFFPLFTLLEDVGYLPRIAFNMDRSFCRACAHGKQALTTCMGFGCNAVGVSGCNIIDSPRERLIAILTNNFVPCNGRFPTIIMMSGILIGGGCAAWLQPTLSALVVFAVIVLGVCMTFLCSKLLSMTVLKGIPSRFTLELPPYRKPKVLSVIVRSMLDRTVFVLGRAVSVAAPAGIVIWILANVRIADISILQHCVGFLDPFARIFGLDGCILLAFLLGLPANEIVVPLMLMCYLSQGMLMDVGNLEAIRVVLADNGWTLLTVVNVILFMLMHFPCATTLLTIRKETGSMKWTLLAFALPTVCGLLCCLLTTGFARLIQFF